MRKESSIIGLLGLFLGIVSVLLVLELGDKKVEVKEDCTCLQQIQGRTYTVGDTKVITDKEGRLMQIKTRTTSWVNKSLKSN